VKKKKYQTDYIVESAAPSPSRNLRQKSITDEMGIKPLISNKRAHLKIVQTTKLVLCDKSINHRISDVCDLLLNILDVFM
jgi:hypothetical protein